MVRARGRYLHRASCLRLGLMMLLLAAAVFIMGSPAGNAQAAALGEISVGGMSTTAVDAAATGFEQVSVDVGASESAAQPPAGARELRPAPARVPPNGFAPETEAAAGASTDLAELEAGGGRGASFITNSNGESVPVPEGATGPTPVRSGNGFQFTGGSGGNGLNSRVAGVRIMDPVTSGKYTYPNGYVSYFNEAGQTVNPYTGQTISPSDPFWHWAWSP